MVSCARLLNILTPELIENCDQFLLRCQSYEGGIGKFMKIKREKKKQKRVEMRNSQADFSQTKVATPEMRRMGLIHFVVWLQLS